MRPLLIDGHWTTTTNAVENINPSDVSDVIDVFAQGGERETRDAISAAAEAFKSWSLSPPLQRHDVLKTAGDEIWDRRVEIGTLLSREEGKILSEGIAETERAAQIFRFFAGEALRQTGENLASVRPGIGVEMTREPLGVIGIIAPWNFPIAIPAWKIAPAICFGNTVVFKPAEIVPGCAWTIVDILHRAGLPPGVLNMVMGKGSVVGQAIVDDPRVVGISFTGSTGTGQRIAQSSVKLMRRLQLEMGGKNPLVVLDDADLDVAVESALNGSFFSTGQRCTASSRLVVTEGIHGRFVEALTQRVRTLVVDHALKRESQMGPVVDETQLAQDLKYVDIARRQGGNIRFGGEVLERDTKGFYLSPALVTDTTSDMTINREEVFGPVASVIRVRNYDEALSVANDTEFGLTAGICTTSLKHATDFKKRAEAGMVMVNMPTAGVDFHVPFGGRKASSHGPREQGTYAKEFYTIVKTAYTNA